MRGFTILAVALAALAGVALAQGTAGRAPPWAQTLIASDIVATTGGRARLLGDGIEFAVRLTIAPAQGGVARVIRLDGRADSTSLALRRFTGHPTAGWWLWGGDTPAVRTVTPAQRAQIERLARAALSSGGVGDVGETCRAGEQAYVEIAREGRQVAFTRACVGNDQIGALARALSDLAGSRTEEELQAAAREELLAVDRAFAAMAQAQGVPAAFAHYAAEDAHQFAPGRDPARGREAVAAFWSGWPAGATLEWAPDYAQVSERGDMGWTWGRGVATVNGARTNSRYVTIWRRNYEGEWRFVADIGNEDP